MTGLSRCGRRYPSLTGAYVTARAREAKGSAPQEVVACGEHWHVQRKGTFASGKSGPDPFPPPVRALLAKRDECCQRCGKYARLEAHHRRAKASGGSSARSHTQCACNGVLLCRSCHEWVHLNPTKARGLGLIVLQSVSKPKSIPVRRFALAEGWEEAADDWLPWSNPWWPTCDGGWNDQP